MKLTLITRYTVAVLTWRALVQDKYVVRIYFIGMLVILCLSCSEQNEDYRGLQVD